MKEQVNKGNKLIAEFMKVETESETRRGKTIYLIPFLNQGSMCYEIEQMKYFESWDWLMPVIEKIGEYRYENSELNIDRAYPRTFGMSSNEDSSLKLFRFNRMPLHQSETLIEASWKAVIEFIEYYNESLKT